MKRTGGGGGSVSVALLCRKVIDHKQLVQGNRNTLALLAFGSNAICTNKTTKVSCNSDPRYYSTSTIASSTYQKSLSNGIKSVRVTTGVFKDVNNVDDALLLLRKMTQMRPLPSFIEFNKLLGGIAKRKHYSAVISFFNVEISTLGTPPVNGHTLNIVINCYCHLNRVDYGYSVLAIFFKRGFLPDVSTFNSLLKGCFMENRVNEAMDLFDKVTRYSLCEPDFCLHGTVINGLCKFGHTNEAIALLNKMEKGTWKPDSTLYNTVLYSLSKDGMIDDAFKFLYEMIDKGVSPNSFTYNSLVHGLCRAGDVDRARGLLRELQGKIGHLPDVVTYTSVISGYCKLGRVDEAVSILNEMVSSGVKPNLFTFNALIDGFGKNGEIISAMRTYDRMVVSGCTPDVVTFTSLIDGYCRIGDLDQGLKLWDEMIARNLHPNLYTFSILISGLCKENRLNEARGLLTQLQLRNDIVPQPFVYNPVIDGFCKAGNIDEANAIAAEMEAERCHHDKMTYTILILGHCMKGRMTEAINIFNKMLAVGCPVDDITVNSLVSCLRKAGMAKEARQIKRTALEGFRSCLPPSADKSMLLRERMGISISV